MDVEIRHLARGDEALVLAARGLFDHDPEPAATRRFLADPTHHLLVAYGPSGAPAGFVSGVEMTHPDNVGARATYARAGARTSAPQVIAEWDLGGVARQHVDPS